MTGCVGTVARLFLLEGKRHARPQAHPGQAMTASSQNLPPAPQTAGCDSLRTACDAVPPPCVPHKHARLIGSWKRPAGPGLRFPRLARGKPFSADPDCEVLRLNPHDPRRSASLQRLAVYLRAERAHCRHRFGGRGRRGSKKVRDRFAPKPDIDRDGLQLNSC
jgi:hypothetical protein